MHMATLNNEELKLLAMLEQQTGAVARDVIVGDEGIMFIVKPGDAGKAIGKGGANIKKVQKLFSKPVGIVEDSETAEGFLRNLLAPATLKSVTNAANDGKTVLQVEVDPEKKGVAIGKGGERVRRARALLKRRFNIDDIKIL